MSDKEEVKFNPDGGPRRRVFLLMLVILVGGLALRLYGLNWDQGYGVHPDERYITWIASSLRVPDRLSVALDPDQTGLSPYMWPPDGRPPEARVRPFSYGHLPLYLMVLVAGGDVDETRLALVGRALSALFDTVTILLTFVLGRLLYDAATGLLAAAFVALTVMHIQLAHFAAFDTALTCFVVATLLFAVRFTRYRRRRDAIAAAICLGLAVGCKFSAILLVVPLVMAHALCWERWLSGAKGRRLRRPASLLALSALVAVVAFVLTNPFSLLQLDRFVTDLRSQGAMLQGDEAFPFTFQYHGTLPVIYVIEQQMRWGMGLPLGLVAFGGLVYALIQVWRRPSSAERWVPLAWVVVYLGVIGSLYVKFMRYVLPVLPVLAIYGAALVWVCVRRSRVAGATRHQKGKWRLPAIPGLERGLGIAFAVLVILPTSLYALAFLSVYHGEHPWLRLSRWIYAHVPPGATIAYEEWDHQLPLLLTQAGRARWPDEFRQLALDMYAPDTPEKLHRLLEQLAASDYLVIASNRLYGSTARWPERYPLTFCYYEHLFAGQLGYDLVPLAGIERQPQLGPLALVADPFGAVDLPSPLSPGRQQPVPLTVHLGRADESFTVYDHPRPLLFLNTGRFSPAQMERLFSAP